MISLESDGRGLQVPWLGGDVLERLLTPERARAAVERALMAERAGEAAAPLRQLVDMPAGTLFVMPAALDGSLAVKLLNDRPHASAGATLPGVVVLFDEASGQPCALMDGPVLTALRTAAIAGWATARLARARRRVALVGAGFQAWYQAAALVDLGGVEAVAIWNRHGEAAEQLAARLRRRHPDLAIRVAPSVPDAVADADVITVATRSPEPLLTRGMVPPHAHVNAMGAYRPTERECAADLMVAAAVYADTPTGVRHEAGDVAIPIAQGQLAAEAVHALADAPPVPPAGLTVMKSVGAAVFDVAAARMAWVAWQGSAEATAGIPSA